jgi:hypothetical protein
MRPPNLLFALVLVAAFGVKAASAQPPMARKVRRASLTAAAMAGTFARSRHRGACGAVSAARRGPFPLAVIAHASTQNVLRRAQMPQPEYRAARRWLVARGFAVLVPSVRAMVRRAENTSKIRAAATRPTTPGPAAPRRMRSPPPQASAQAILHPPDGMVVIGHSAGPGARWRWPAKIRRKLPPSSRSRRGAAGMPMIFRPGLRAAYADRRAGAFGKPRA